MEIINNVFLIIMGFVAGYVYREVMFIRDLAQITRRLNEKLNPKSDIRQIEVAQVRKLRHEMIDNINYFYCSQENTFIAQGANLDDAAGQCAQVLGDEVMAVFVHVENKQNYCFVAGRCCEYQIDSE